MSQSVDRILAGNSERTSKALDGARPTSRQSSPPSQLRLAVVISADSGTYTVGLVGTDGSIVDSIPGVRVWGGASTFAAGDKALLVYLNNRPIPFIIGGMGGGGGGGTIDFGIVGEMWFT